MGFLSPETDPSGNGFQVLQSLIAIGSGGVTGQGLGESAQKLYFLPLATSDFIFSIVSEELGLIGAAAVLAGFAVLAWRGYVAGHRAPDAFGRFLAWGLTSRAADPGAGQRQRHRRPGAGHRHASAVPVSRRILPGHDPGRVRPAAERFGAWMSARTPAPFGGVLRRRNRRPRLPRPGRGGGASESRLAHRLDRPRAEPGGTPGRRRGTRVQGAAGASVRGPRRRGASRRAGACWRRPRCVPPRCCAVSGRRWCSPRGAMPALRPPSAPG